MARTKTRTRSVDHYYPAWVFTGREGITRRNMELYDRQQEQTTARCLEIDPDYYARNVAERYSIWKQARHDLGLE